MMPAWTDAQQKNYWRAIRKAVDGGLKQAKTALESGPEVPREESTMLELCRLFAVDVDDAERCVQTLAAMRARALHAACPTLRMKHLRSRVWRLKTVASPGPSGWRNTHFQAVARARGGMPAEDGKKALEQSVMGIDMENAYGRVLRSSCIQATLELAPGLAALTGIEWQL